MKMQPVNSAYPLVLASSSPRRKRLLKQVGIPFRVLNAGIEEDGMDEGRPDAAARLLAEKKARAVQNKAKSHWILGADTMVVLENSILGKPGDPEEARAMLSTLGGKEHRVITGFCLLDPLFRVSHLESVSTLVRFKLLSPMEIDAYINTGEPFGKAGSYAIQGIGAFLVESISGSYTNVVGLPVCALIKAMVAVGALKGFPL